MKYKFIIFLLSIIFLSGCGAKTIYYWGDYSGSLYDYTKEPSLKTKKSHKAELVNIIKKSEKRKDKKVPPGIYFELAMLYAEEGEVSTAQQYLLKEKDLFPESTKSVELALKELDAKWNSTI